MGLGCEGVLGARLMAATTPPGEEEGAQGEEREQQGRRRGELCSTERSLRSCSPLRPEAPSAPRVRMPSLFTTFCWELRLEDVWG